MKKIFIIFSLVGLLVSCSSVKSILGEPTALETATAIKKILNNSTLNAVASLQKLNNNGVETLLPEQVQPALKVLRSMGMTEEVDQISTYVGEATKVALDESGHLIKESIATLSFTDGAKIVLGGKNAATQVLKEAMYSSVKKRYVSKIDAELEKTDLNQYWPTAATTVNMLSSEKVPENLSEFVAERAVDLLFLNIGSEEEKNRLNYKDLKDVVVNRVFDYYTKK